MIKLITVPMVKEATVMMKTPSDRSPHRPEVMMVTKMAVESAMRMTEENLMALAMMETAILLRLLFRRHLHLTWVEALGLLNHLMNLLHLRLGRREEMTIS